MIMPVRNTVLDIINLGVALPAACAVLELMRRRAC